MSVTPTEERRLSGVRDVSKVDAEKARELQKLEPVSSISDDDRVVVEWEEGDLENPLVSPPQASSDSLLIDQLELVATETMVRHHRRLRTGLQRHPFELCAIGYRLGISHPIPYVAHRRRAHHIPLRCWVLCGTHTLGAAFRTSESNKQVIKS